MTGQADYYNLQKKNELGNQEMILLHFRKSCFQMTAKNVIYIFSLGIGNIGDPGKQINAFLNLK